MVFLIIYSSSSSRTLTFSTFRIVVNACRQQCPLSPYCQGDWSTNLTCCDQSGTEIICSPPLTSTLTRTPTQTVKLFPQSAPIIMGTVGATVFLMAVVLALRYKRQQSNLLLAIPCNVSSPGQEQTPELRHQQDEVRLKRIVGFTKKIVGFFSSVVCCLS